MSCLMAASFFPTVDFLGLVPASQGLGMFRRTDIENSHLNISPSVPVVQKAVSPSYILFGTATLCSKPMSPL
jgi:hypothetical protein